MSRYSVMSIQLFETLNITKTLLFSKEPKDVNYYYYYYLKIHW